MKKGWPEYGPPNDRPKTRSGSMKALGNEGGHFSWGANGPEVGWLATDA